MIIKVAFYKGRRRWHNRFIRWWTNSIYSHAELVMPDGYTWISISPFCGSKILARFKPVYDFDKWDFIAFAITDDQYKTIVRFYDQTADCRYDWVGMILSQFLPFHIKQKGRWYCSEWIANALTISNVLDWGKTVVFERSDLTPGLLYNMLLEEGTLWEDILPCSGITE